MTDPRIKRWEHILNAPQHFLTGQRKLDAGIYLGTVKQLQVFKARDGWRNGIRGPTAMNRRLQLARKRLLQSNSLRAQMFNRGWVNRWFNPVRASALRFGTQRRQAIENTVHQCIGLQQDYIQTLFQRGTKSGLFTPQADSAKQKFVHPSLSTFHDGGATPVFSPSDSKSSGLLTNCCESKDPQWRH
jgi:hypothetical protein